MYELHMTNIKIVMPLKLMLSVQHLSTLFLLIVT
jgi:hypothetical protein